MRKLLTALVTGAIVATTLVACGKGGGDTSISSTQIGERIPGDVEVIDNDLPVAYSHLVGNSAPDSVGVICVGDHAFLYTWYAQGYGGGSGTTRFAEQDELCTG